VDPFNLNSFIAAQSEKLNVLYKNVYERAIQEIKCACKATHWMWFIFPNLRREGDQSENTRLYGISGKSEARAYLAHSKLGSRLREAVTEVFNNPYMYFEIFGAEDSVKYRKCLELFAPLAGGLLVQALQKVQDERKNPTNVFDPMMCAEDNNPPEVQEQLEFGRAFDDSDPEYDYDDFENNYMELEKNDEYE
jgi:uncharacterized protein (DUF1810 family)